MHPARKKRLLLIILMVAGISVATAAIVTAMSQNLNLFFPPRDVAAGLAPENTTFRVGGLVKPGSVSRDQSSLAVNFVIYDMEAEVTVSYEGILPDLFAEDEAAVATGQLTNGVFVATQVLAKHDENYTPPEVADAMSQQAEEGSYK